MLRSAHLGPSSQVIVMILKTSIGLAFAAACLTAIVTMPVRADTARQNVIQSERYDRLLETNRAFRQARMRKECGPITDPQLHQQCLASFSQVPSRFVLEFDWRGLRLDEDTWSGSKVNRLIGEFLGQALPSVHFAHCDLT